MFKEVSGFADSIIIATIVILVLCGFIIMNLVFFYLKRKKHLDREKLLKAQFQQTILQTQLEIQEQTFKNISQEIHDNIGQTLSLAKLNINTMDSDKREELEEKIYDSGQLITKAIQDLRDLSKSMNTDLIVEMGLVQSIEYEASLLRKAGVYTVQLQVEGHYAKLPPQHELILFRMFQEMINNIINHAAASEIRIRLYCGDPFVLEVQDNGKGFDSTALLQNAGQWAGLGLRNMKSRAALIGAQFHIESAIGKGTTICVKLPFSQTAATP
jgi:signal transduction histidine kinase